MCFYRLSFDENSIYLYVSAKYSSGEKCMCVSTLLQNTRIKKICYPSSSSLEITTTNTKDKQIQDRLDHTTRRILLNLLKII